MSIRFFKFLATAALMTAGSAHATLIHYWTFDDAELVGSKGAGDSVGSADALATGTNGGTRITTGQAGLFGQAYRFQGNGQAPSTSAEESLLAVAPGNVPDGAAERTFALWFSVLADSQQNKLFGYGLSNTDGNGNTAEAFDVGLEGGGIRVRNFNGNFTYGSGFDFDGNDAGWHHLAVRVNPNAVTFADVDFFLNGTMLAPQDAGDPDLGDTLATILDNADGFGIGNTTTPGGINGFDGLLDEFRVYDNALSNAEIAQLAVMPGVVMGDTDGDGDIDGTDMLNALSGYTGPGGIGATPSSGDTDNDGDVDDDDIQFIINNYGSTSAIPANVPEPASLGSVAIGLLMLARRRNTRLNCNRIHH